MTNKNKVYESDSIAALALPKLSANFKSDLEALIRFCVKRPQYKIYKRLEVGMPPEPYGIDTGTNKPTVEELLAHADSILGQAMFSWQWLYNILEDRKSKLLLLNVIAYRVIGWRYLTLPLDTDNFWSELKNINLKRSLKEKKDKIATGFFGMVLEKFNLVKYGYPVKIYSDAFGVFNEFIYSQYSFRGKKLAKPAKGDCIIDCGACYGGTSLYFANLVGKNGKVLSFEFMKNNIKIFDKNMILNPNIKSRIELIKSPVYSLAGLIMRIQGSGPATQVHPIGKGLRVMLKELIYQIIYKLKINRDEVNYVKSTTIDLEVKKRKIKNVGLIKMDIEGSEYRALEGGKATIQMFKPILAISVYHRLIDFYEVPQFINNLNLGYKFYLQHSTVHGDETVIFAIPPIK
jgi:FkbM family methyltransferase